jgi:hypothetical protein
MPQKTQTEEQRQLDLEESLELIKEQPSRGRGSAATDADLDDAVVDAIWADDIKKYRRAIEGAAPSGDSPSTEN